MQEISFLMLCGVLGGLPGHTTLNYALHGLGTRLHSITFQSSRERKALLIMYLSVIPKTSFVKITWTFYIKKKFKSSFASLAPEKMNRYLLGSGPRKL